MAEDKPRLKMLKYEKMPVRSVESRWIVAELAETR